MNKIAVFDSGLGSLSIIKEIQKTCKCSIIYLADHKNFPYGNKTKSQLYNIINETIELLNLKFNPKLIILASNTPTILLQIENKKIIGVKPPIKRASKLSKTKHIGIMGTSSLIQSKMLTNYISNEISPSVTIHKINASPLVELVESGKFLTNKKYCIKIIQKYLEKIISNNKIDVCMLSSTHLPFLKPILENMFFNVKFIDPGNDVAAKVCKSIQNTNYRNSLKIYSTKKTKTFEKNLQQLGIKNKINFLNS